MRNYAFLPPLPLSCRPNGHLFEPTAYRRRQTGLHRPRCALHSPSGPPSASSKPFADSHREASGPHPKRPPRHGTTCRRTFLALGLASVLQAPLRAKADVGSFIASALEDSDLPDDMLPKGEFEERRGYGYRALNGDNFDPFNLYGRLAPKPNKPKRRRTGNEEHAPSAARDPNVHMSIFGSDEDDEESEEDFDATIDDRIDQVNAGQATDNLSGPWTSASEKKRRRRRPPKTYDEALYAEPDLPLDIAFVENLKLAGALGGGVLLAALFVAVSERVTVPRSEALPVKYDRELIQRYCMQRPERVVARVSQFAVEIVRYAGRTAMDKVLDSVWIGGAGGKATRRRRRAQALREGITRLGPGVIKLGQAAASRPDLVGRTFASELQLLQDSIFQGVQSDEAFAVIREELNAKVSDIYAYIDPNPIAGASLGMVFRAWLFETESRRPSWVGGANASESNGGTSSAEMDEIERLRPELRGKRRVAVKVQRPQVAELCALDFFIVGKFAKLAGYIFNVRTNLGLVVDEYASSVFEELNYVVEASNVQKFRALYCDGKRLSSNTDMCYVYVPRVYPMYSSRRVLTTEWFDMEPLTDAMARVKPGDLRLVEVGVRSALEQCLSVGFVHCDQHSGNLMKLRGGTDGGRLALVDFGICAQIPEYTRQSMGCALMHLMHRDYTTLADSFADMSLMRGTDLDAEMVALSEALASAFHDVAPVDVDRNKQVSSNGEDLYRARLQKFTFIGVAERLITLGESFPLVFRDYFLSILRSLAMLEGLAFNANSNFNIVDLVYPHVVSLVLTGPASTPYRSSLRRLVVVEDEDSPGQERVNLVSLERLVRLSRPHALTTRSGVRKVPEELRETKKARRRRRQEDAQQRSVLRFALSRDGALVLMLAIGQFESDRLLLITSWVDRVLFRVAPAKGGNTDGAVGGSPPASAAEKNIGIVRHVLRRERHIRLGFWARFKLVRIKVRIFVYVAALVVAHCVGRIFSSLFQGFMGAFGIRTTKRVGVNVAGTDE